MIAGGYIMLPEGMEATYSSVNPANIEIITDPFDRDFLEGIKNVDGVADAEARRSISVRVRVAENEWKNLTLTAIQDFTEHDINQLTPQEGVAVPPDHSIILLDEALPEIRTSLGDTLEIQLQDGTTKFMDVVGTTKDRTTGIEGILDKKVGYITGETLTWLHADDSFNQLLVVVSGNTNDENHIQLVENRIVDRIEDNNRQVYQVERARQNEHPLGYIIDALISVLGILGILIGFLSGSLVMNTFNSLLTQHTRQIGVMKLVGARSRQIIGMYMMNVFIYGLISLAIGIPTGAMGARLLSNSVVDILNISLVNTSPVPLIPIVILLQVFIGLVVPLVTALIPVVRGSRVTVQRAVSGDMNTEEGKAQWVDRSLENLPGVKGISTIAIRNTFRRKGRLLLTLLTLSLGGAIFISVFNVRISLNQKNEQVFRYFSADVNLDFSRSYRTEEIEKVAKQVPGVISVEGWSTAAGEVINPVTDTTDATISILGPPADSELIDPTMLEGRWIVPGDEKALALNEAVWDVYPNIAPGDTIRLKISGQEDDWVVTGIYQYAGLDRLFGYANYESLAKVNGLLNEASTYRVVLDQHDRAYQERVGAQIDNHFKELGFDVRGVEAGAAFVEHTTDLLGILILVLLMLAVITAVVGSIGLAGTLSMNILERTREIGVLRAVGAYDQVVITMVILEGLFIGFLSYVIGVALSFPITGLLSDVVNEAIFNSPGNWAFTYTGFLIWMAAVALLSTLASVIPARSASRMTIREVLAYE